MKKQTKAPPVRVLIVDNHALLRRGVASVIEAETDFEICGEVGNEEALQAIAKLKPDVAIVDLSLYGSTGLELIRQIAYDPRTKILALDLHSEPTYATRAIKSGARGYLTRDAETALPAAVRRIHAGHLSISDDMAQQMIATLSTTHATGADSIENLSDRELEIAEAIGKGLPASQIAIELKISIKTVETHKAHIKKKLGIAKGSQLTRYCVAWYERRNAARR